LYYKRKFNKMEYQELISAKVVSATKTGLQIEPENLHTSLFPHQRDITMWNIEGGCRAGVSGALCQPGNADALWLGHRWRAGDSGLSGSGRHTEGH
jgi:hypothetical protein